MTQNGIEFELPAAGRSPTSSPADHVSLAGIVWERKSLLALGVAVALVVGALCYAQATPIYKSEAQVLVVKRHADAVTGDATHTSHFEDYIATHRIIMQSPVIVEHAIQLGKLNSFKCFENKADDLVATIIKRLSVTRVSKDAVENPNSVLNIAFSGTVPSECGEVVNAILDSYKQFLDDTYRQMSDDSVKLIAEARRVLEVDLAKEKAAYRDFREKSPMILRGKDDVNPRQERLAQIDGQRSLLMLRQADYEGQLAALQDARKAGRTQEDLMALVSDLAGKPETVNSDHNVSSPSSSSLKSELLPLLLEERTLVEQYGPNHPQVQAIHQRIEATRNFFALPSASYSKAAEKGGGASGANLVDLYVQYLQRELTRAKTSEGVLAALYEREHEAARKMSRYEIQDADYRSSIARTEALYDGIVKRLQEATLVKDYGGYDARVIAPAGLGKKASPNALSFFGSALFLGILGGLGLVYLAEITDKRFRTPEEIRRRLGLPLMGHIPCRLPDRAARKRAAADGGLDPMLFMHHQPRSTVAESYRALRTAVYFSRAAVQHKVLQVTSPIPGDGKSTVAANLAISIAQSGKSTLLIDADLRKPQQQRLFAVGTGAGLVSVIAEDSEIADAICETRIHNLWVLPCGPLPANPAELLTSPRFPALLELLRQQYDYVVIDSPPLLSVADASIVAPRVDGVLLVVRISKYGRIAAERAREILAGLGAKALGVVVNAVHPNGKNAYRHAYGYSYGYGYGYGDGDGDGAYEEHDGHAAENGDRLDPEPRRPRPEISGSPAPLIELR